MNITFTPAGKALTSAQWAAGYTWGGREWSGDGDDGNIFSIKLTISQSSITVGLNKVIQSSFLNNDPVSSSVDPLLALVNSSFFLLRTFLNDSTKTNNCWLCLSNVPPFYDAIASSEPISNSTSDARCRWNTSSITISSIKGQGCCLGNIPTNYSQYCLNTSHRHVCHLYLPADRLGLHTAGYSTVYTATGGNIAARLKGQFFIPGNNSIWACSTGATACVHGDILIAQKSFCIQVRLFPKITYYPSDQFVSLVEPPEYPLHQKREIVTALTLSVLLGLGAAGAATGAAALAINSQEITRLSSEIDEDLQRIETSISALQTSLSSLAEVVLQNRRGLDLLFLSKGGLCVALKEECCFYADHSGIVTDSMTQLRERLKNRERERQSQMSWYQGLFNVSPWLTTLLSALIGPLVLLLIACSIGPCVMGRVVRLLKGRIQALDDEVSNTKKDLHILQKKIPSDPCKRPLLTLSSDESESEDEKAWTPKKLGWGLDRLGSEETIPSLPLEPSGVPEKIMCLEFPDDQ